MRSPWRGDAWGLESSGLLDCKGAVKNQSTNEGTPQIVVSKESKKRKEQVKLKRCFKWLGFGHIAKACLKSNGKPKQCRRYEVEGHISKNCQAYTNCSLCKGKEYRHTTGSSPHRKPKMWLIQMYFNYCRTTQSLLSQTITICTFRGGLEWQVSKDWKAGKLS